MDIILSKKAWEYAAEVHKEQTMPGSQRSYLEHLGFVFMELVAANVREAIDGIDLALQCAILHDTREDQGVSHGDLVERFGIDVAQGVSALTKSNTLEKLPAMMDSLQRIRAQPKAIWCVKLSDRICNLSNIPSHWNATKVLNYCNEAELILRELRMGNQYLAHRLETVIQELRAKYA